MRITKKNYININVKNEKKKYKYIPCLYFIYHERQKSTPQESRPTFNLMHKLVPMACIKWFNNYYFYVSSLDYKYKPNNAKPSKKEGEKKDYHQFFVSW